MNPLRYSHQRSMHRGIRSDAQTSSWSHQPLRALRSAQSFQRPHDLLRPARQLFLAQCPLA